MTGKVDPKVLPVIPEYVEKVARMLCVLRQLDPEEPIQLQPQRHLINPVAERIEYVPRWVLAAQEVESFMLIAEAINRVGKETPLPGG